MAESVMVVAGMLGNTVASTAWIRCQPGTRPRRSVCKPRGAAFMGKLPPLWKLRPGSAILSITGSGSAPVSRVCLQSLNTSLRTCALAAGFNSARSSSRSLPVAGSFRRRTAMRELCWEWRYPCATSIRSFRSRTRRPNGLCNGPNDWATAWLTKSLFE